jgi:uncharacterized protein (DUF1684 family)
MTPLSLALSLLVQAAPAQAAAPRAAAVATASAAQDPVAAQKAWHQERLKQLTAEDGWLTLVGLHWLKEGESLVGSAGGNDIRLPASTPATVGTLAREGKFVTFTPKQGVEVRVEGKPFLGGPIGSDISGKPDVLEVGTVRFHLISRGGRLGVRVRDTAAAGRRNFKPIPLFPYNPAWRVEARLETGSGPTKLAVPNILGTVEEMPSPGTLVFTFGGKEYRLTPVVEQGDDSLFLVFADESNRSDSYVSGRFLSAPMPVDGKTVIDFNRATNPPCAFTQFATCPLPPRANRLAVRVDAGEKRAGAH